MSLTSPKNPELGSGADPLVCSRRPRRLAWFAAGGSKGGAPILARFPSVEHKRARHVTIQEQPALQ
jgi:hypothetical protein